MSKRKMGLGFNKARLLKSEQQAATGQHRPLADVLREIKPPRASERERCEHGHDLEDWCPDCTVAGQQ